MRSQLFLIVFLFTSRKVLLLENFNEESNIIDLVCLFGRREIFFFLLQYHKWPTGKHFKQSWATSSSPGLNSKFIPSTTPTIHPLSQQHQHSWCRNMLGVPNQACGSWPIREHWGLWELKWEHSDRGWIEELHHWTLDTFHEKKKSVI